MHDAARSQHPNSRNEDRTCWFVREGRCRKKGSDTVGEFQQMIIQWGYPRKAGHSVPSGLQTPETETARNGPLGHSEQ